jgi:hypothetical protein
VLPRMPANIGDRQDDRAGTSSPSYPGEMSMTTVQPRSTSAAGRSVRIALGTALVTASLLLNPAAVQAHDQQSTGQIVSGRLNPDSGNADVLVGRPDGSGVHAVPTQIPTESLGGAFWSPDGEHLLITNLMRLPEPFRPAIVKPDGAGFRLLEFPGLDPDMFCSGWALDGRRIACGVSDGILSLPTNGTSHSVRRLTTNPYGGKDLFGDYSPDSRQIIFPMYTAADDRVDLYTVRLDGSHLTRITNTPEDENFADWTS